MRCQFHFDGCWVSPCMLTMAGANNGNPNPAKARKHATAARAEAAYSVKVSMIYVWTHWNAKMIPHPTRKNPWREQMSCSFCLYFHVAHDLLCQRQSNALASRPPSQRWIDQSAERSIQAPSELDVKQYSSGSSLRRKFQHITNVVWTPACLGR